MKLDRIDIASYVGNNDESLLRGGSGKKPNKVKQKTEKRRKLILLARKGFAW